MDKKTEAIILGYSGNAVRIDSLIPSQPKARLEVEMGSGLFQG